MRTELCLCGFSRKQGSPGFDDKELFFVPPKSCGHKCHGARRGKSHSKKQSGGRDSSLLIVILASHRAFCS